MLIDVEEWAENKLFEKKIKMFMHVSDVILKNLSHLNTNFLISILNFFTVKPCAEGRYLYKRLLHFLKKIFINRNDSELSYLFHI
jgi:hypothetical protein